MMRQYSSLMDQTAMAFVLSQITYIETEVYETQYEEVQYPGLIPVETSAPDWTPSVTHFSSDRRGRAQFINGSADDIPKADLDMTKHEEEVYLAAIGYDVTLEEANQALMKGVRIEVGKADAAREAAEEFIDDVAMRGEGSQASEGLINLSAIQVVTAPNGEAGTPEWDTKTNDEILADINTLLVGINNDTKRIETANTLILSVDRHYTLMTRRIDGTSDTLWDYVMKANAYTAKTGNPLEIRAVSGLETAGAGGVQRMLAYNKNPRVLKLHNPMPFRFLQPYHAGPLRMEVPGVFRLGQLEIRRPGAMRYMDGM